MKRSVAMGAIGVLALASQLAFGNLQTGTEFQPTDSEDIVQVEHSDAELEAIVEAAGQDGVVVDGFWVPAALALKACMKHPKCKKIAAKSAKAGIKWAIDNLINEIF